MLELVKCDCCNKYGTFDFYMEFVYDEHGCDHCSHMDYYKWQYSFCDFDCFWKWLKTNEIEEKWLYCRSCLNGNLETTGFAWGIESNGPCQMCNGTKRVKFRKNRKWQTGYLMGDEPVLRT